MAKSVIATIPSVLSMLFMPVQFLGVEPPFAGVLAASTLHDLSSVRMLYT